MYIYIVIKYMMYLFITVPHPHGHWQLQKLLGNNYVVIVVKHIIIEYNIVVKCFIVVKSTQVYLTLLKTRFMWTRLVAGMFWPGSYQRSHACLGSSSIAAYRPGQWRLWHLCTTDYLITWWQIDFYRSCEEDCKNWPSILSGAC